MHDVSYSMGTCTQLASQQPPAKVSNAGALMPAFAIRLALCRKDFRGQKIVELQCICVKAAARRKIKGNMARANGGTRDLGCSQASAETEIHYIYGF